MNKRTSIKKATKQELINSYNLEYCSGMQLLKWNECTKCCIPHDYRENAVLQNRNIDSILIIGKRQDRKKVYRAIKSIIKKYYIDSELIESIKGLPVEVYIYSNRVRAHLFNISTEEELATLTYHLKIFNLLA